jgi:rhodanese-related sulfurtransferase
MPQIIGRDEVRRLGSEGAPLVEVLPAKEYWQIHLPGAINIPLATLDAKTATRLPKHRPVVVYCYDFQ